MNSLKFCIPSRINLAVQIMLLMFLGMAGGRADALIGFETSSGYGTNTTVVGIDDSTIPGTTAWTAVYGDAANLVTSTANPQTGSQALRLDKTSTAAVSSALGASLLMGSEVDITKPFNIHFGMALNNISAGTSNQAQIYFGFNGAQPGVQAYWFGLQYSNGALYLLVNKSLSGTDGLYSVDLGQYTDYANLGGYITFDIGIDPTTMKYTNVQVSGALKTSNRTVQTLGTASGGTLPHITVATPDTYLTVISGGGDAITADFDNIQFTNVVPEPSTASLFFLGALGLGWSGMRRRHAR